MGAYSCIYIFSKDYICLNMYIIFHLNLDVINLCQIMVDLVSGCQILVYRKKEFKKSNMYIIFLYNLGEENGGPLEKSFSIVGPASLQKESSYRPVEHNVLI